MTLSKLQIVQLVLGAIAFAITLTILILYADLQKSIAGLRAERDTLARQTAALSAQIPLMDMAISDNASEVDYLTSGYTAGPCSAESKARARSKGEEATTQLLNICDALQKADNGWQVVLDFYKAYNAALSARFAARTPQDYARVAALYSTAIAKGNASGIDDDWRVRVREGKAYALLRQKDYAEAIALARQASALATHDKNYPIFVFADLTAIKIACARGDDAGAIRAHYRDLLDGLKALGRKFAPGTDYARFAIKDLATARGDPELPLYCGNVQLQD